MGEAQQLLQLLHSPSPHQGDLPRRQDVSTARRTLRHRAVLQGELKNLSRFNCMHIYILHTYIFLGNFHPQGDYILHERPAGGSEEQQLGQRRQRRKQQEQPPRASSGEEEEGDDGSGGGSRGGGGGGASQEQQDKGE